MNLSETLYMMMQQNQRAGQPTDLRTGTVTSADPLEISINTAMAPLRREVLLLTESVVEKKIPVLTHVHDTSGFAHTHQISTLSHSHQYSGGTTQSALTSSYTTQEGLSQDTFTSDQRLSEITCYENGQPLPAEGGYIILNRALAVGDRVLLLRVQNGQRYIVLSRVFE